MKFQVLRSNEVMNVNESIMTQKRGIQIVFYKSKILRFKRESCQEQLSKNHNVYEWHQVIIQPTGPKPVTNLVHVGMIFWTKVNPNMTWAKPEAQLPSQPHTKIQALLSSTAPNKKWLMTKLSSGSWESET